VLTPVTRSSALDDLGDMTLLDVEPFLAFAGRLQPELVRLLVALGARSADARALGSIEHAELNAGRVGIEAHLAAQRVDLPHDLPLARPPMAGLHDICPMVSRFIVSSNVSQPIREAASAASAPAWPAPMTMTS
jgi:hypothetical protein